MVKVNINLFIHSTRVLSLNKMAETTSSNDVLKQNRNWYKQILNIHDLSWFPEHGIICIIGGSDEKYDIWKMLSQRKESFVVQNLGFRGP